MGQSRDGEVPQRDLTGTENSLQFWTCMKKLRRQLHLTEIIQGREENAGEWGGKLHDALQSPVTKITCRKSGNVKGILAFGRVVDLLHLPSCHPM